MANKVIDNFYYDLGFRIDDEKLKAFSQWTVLNHGLITGRIEMGKINWTN